MYHLSNKGYNFEVSGLIDREGIGILIYKNGQFLRKIVAYSEHEMNQKLDEFWQSELLKERNKSNFWKGEFED